jgi:hypothetical protein
MAFQRCFYLKNFRTICRYPGDAEPAALNITAGPPSLDGGQAKSSSSSGFKKDSNPFKSVIVIAYLLDALLCPAKIGYW